MMIGRSAFALQAGIALKTIGRIESGYHSRIETQRKILKALGLKNKDRYAVFYPVTAQEHPGEDAEKKKEEQDDEVAASTKETLRFQVNRILAKYRGKNISGGLLSDIKKEVRQFIFDNRERFKGGVEWEVCRDLADPQKLNIKVPLEHWFNIFEGE